MTRQQFIQRTIRALCGDAPSRPDIYWLAVGMADRTEKVYTFDKQTLSNR